ncbi:EAL and HDOD domain-containing protein [Robertmurraya kyonggiensis]|nr:HDOD domain-containing protein [Robertmurraya kyonggiensis]
MKERKRGEGMEVFVAKQPIFNREQEVYAYELLYRSSTENSFPDIDGDQATADVIINSYLNIGIEELSNGKPCFINFTEKLLQLRLPTFFTPREIVVEILESIEPSEELVCICRELKQLGYQVALDDVVLNEENPYSYQLFQCADMIKVDFLSTPKKIRKRIEKIAKENSIKLVAEKLETKEAFAEAKRIGYDYFQGYYLAQPTIVSTYDVPTYFYFDYKNIEELAMTESSMDSITELIEKDLSLSYKLLKLVNSPFNRTKQKINSVKQAVMLLGLIEIKKWLYIFSVRNKVQKDSDLSKHVVQLSLTRAKMCESIERIANYKTAPSASFTLGMFSIMDKLTGVPMEKIIAELPFEEELRDALTGVQNSLKDVLDLVTAVEKAQWGVIRKKCEVLSIEETEIFKIYAESLSWSNQLMETERLEII